jgi:lipoprotein-anchoring transpeptidase ErfK/SrfK
LSIIGVLALIATGAFVWISMDSSAGQAVGKRPKVSSPSPSESPSAAVIAAPTEGPEFSPGPFSFSNHPGATQAAFGALGKIPIFSGPGGGQTRVIDNPTREGMQVVFGVRENQGEWLKVQLPIRPNGTTGWVRASDVVVKTVPNHIVVEVGNRRLSAFKGSQLLMQTKVGVGTPKTPTPTGTFYVDFSVKNPGSPYGAHMLSVAGFSNVLRNFGGGVGQIAIHGWGNDGSVGQMSSNGCLRLTNGDVVRLAGMAPPGTPVFIVP